MIFMCANRLLHNIYDCYKLPLLLLKNHTHALHRHHKIDLIQMK